MGWQRRLGWLVVALAVLAAACGRPQGQAPSAGGDAGKPAEPIRVGALFDLTGPTADVGVPHAEGVRAYIDFVNAQGGVNGRKIELVDVDYAYQVPKAVEAYKKLVEQDKVVAIFGWGTGDTEALKAQIARDKIPYISGAYAEQLANPAEAPYNFIVAPTYSQGARIALEWVRQQKPDAKVAMAYNDTPFGRSPLDHAREYAARIGLTWVGEVVVDLRATDATTQVLELNRLGAEYVLIQQTTNATAVILKSAQQQGLLGKIQFIGLHYSTDENAIKAAGSAAEGFVGLPAFFFPYDEGPGIEEAIAYAQSRGKRPEDLNQKWIQGWAHGRIMVEAIRRAGEHVTGEAIKAAFETFRDYDLGGLGAPLTFTASDHAGAKRGKLYVVRNGRWEPLTDWIEPAR